MSYEKKLIAYLKENSDYGFQTKFLAKELGMPIGTLHSIKSENKHLIKAYTFPGKKTYYIIKKNV
jgi:hypothetical protein